MTKLARTAVLLGLVALAACDGDGCHGGPNGAASASCQRTIEQQQIPREQEAAVCRQCCLQEVPYVGTIENGMCVCRR